MTAFVHNSWHFDCIADQGNRALSQEILGIEGASQFLQAIVKELSGEFAGTTNVESIAKANRVLREFLEGLRQFPGYIPSLRLKIALLFVGVYVEFVCAEYRDGL